MKKLAVVLLSALALTTLFACGGSGSTSSSVENKNYGKGKEMSLAFETNPSTGYDCHTNSPLPFTDNLR